MISTRKTRPIAPFSRFAATLLGGLLALAPPGARGQETRDPGPVDRAKLPGRIFVSCFSQDDPLKGIVVVDPNDGAWQGVTDDRSFSSRVSPDGRLVAGYPPSVGGPDPGLRVYRTSGEGRPVKVSEKMGVLCWSPDGKAILVTVLKQGTSESEVWLVVADGSREERLPIPATEIVLDWSPDARWLLTSSLRQRPERSVHLMHPDGTGERLLLAASDPVPEAGGKLGPRAHFSPDGRKILFDHATFEEDVRPPKLASTSLLELDVESGRVRQFFERKGGDYSNSSCWSPDGKAIAVLIIEGNRAGLLQSLRSSRSSKTHIEIVVTDGRTLGTVPLPGVGSFRNVIDWR